MKKKQLRYNYLHGFLYFGARLNQIHIKNELLDLIIMCYPSTIGGGIETPFEKEDGTFQEKPKNH